MIYLCIPAHNEEQTVGVVLWKIRQVLTEFPRDYQILVADDASSDRTADVLAPYARVLPLTVLRTRERRGYSASLEMLLREAVRRSPYPKRDTILTLQADFTDEPEDIVPLLKKVEQGADIVGGVRATDHRPAFIERWLLRWQASLLRRGGWPDGAGEPLAGFRAYRVSVVARALEAAGSERLLSWDGVVADAELLRACAPHARRIESIDLVHRPDRRQRPSRSTTWERTKLLRRFMRGVRPIDTVPLADLAPETLPPPRPVEVERARRSEAAATAAPQKRRNGRGARPAPGRNGARSERAGGERQEARRGAEGAAEGRQRTRGTAAGGESRRRAKPAAPAEAAAPTQRRTRGAESPTADATVAPDAAAPGREATPAEGADATPKKKRRRRRRKPASQRAAQAAAGPPGAVDGTEVPEGPGPDAPQGGTEPVSEGITNDSADGGGTGTPKKKRRRGGRRGGRGRRRRPDGATVEAGDEAAGAAPALTEDGNPAGAGGRPTAEAAHVAGEPNRND